MINFVRSQDEQEQGLIKSSASVVMPSPSRNNKRNKTKQETSTVSTKPAVKKKRNKKKWWFHDKALPDFRKVWNILHDKLDFRYSNGCYKLPFVKETFAINLDMRLYLVEHGIPNMERLSKEERQTVERWVMFAHVPVKNSNSLSKLHGMQELSDEDASNVLINHLGFKEADGSYHRGETESFGSLQDVRDHFRHVKSLAPPVPGRRRNKSTSIDISEERELEFRLWAALSPTSLPTWKSC